VIEVNEQVVHSGQHSAGRAYAPDSDLVRIALKAGRNRLLVSSRQGIGVWSFSVRLSEPPSVAVVSAPAGKSADLEALRAFAMTHDGDPKSGETIFFEAKAVACAKCHSTEGKGSSTIGPDLTGLALKYDRAEIIRSVLEPSSRIANGYQPIVLATRDGRVLTGLVRAETESYVELIDTELKVTRVPTSEIDERKVGTASLMPVVEPDALSIAEFADLVSYLLSLKSAPAGESVRR
jgi:putative heme-binding domain-containing protein